MLFSLGVIYRCQYLDATHWLWNSEANGCTFFYRPSKYRICWKASSLIASVFHFHSLSTSVRYFGARSWRFILRCSPHCVLDNALAILASYFILCGMRLGSYQKFPSLFHSQFVSGLIMCTLCRMGCIETSIVSVNVSFIIWTSCHSYMFPSNVKNFLEFTMIIAIGKYWDFLIIYQTLLIEIRFMWCRRLMNTQRLSSL